MAMVESTMLPLGTKAPAFRLPDTESRPVSLDDFPDANGYVVMFLCNHCPFVKHVRDTLAKKAAEWQGQGLAVVGIMPNDVANYPDDSPEKMRAEVKEAGYTFPYLYDEDQSVAHAYRAACTPDFFLFDAERKLYYRGQLDGSRPGNDVPCDGKDLQKAIDRMLAGKEPPEEQRPSAGCNIKWKAGNEPEWFKS